MHPAAVALVVVLCVALAALLLFLFAGLFVLFVGRASAPARRVRFASRDEVVPISPRGAAPAAGW
jgi:hypothetical protein